MGMGEPLHNYDNTMKALRMLARRARPRGVAAARHAVDGRHRARRSSGWRSEPLMPNLAISLHATTDEQRDALVPPNRKYPLAEILDACRRFPLEEAQPHHVRVRAARRRQRHAGGRAPAGASCCTASRPRST